MSTCSILRVGGARTKVKGALLLDVVVRKSAAILKLLASEDQTLLVRRNTLLVLNLRLDVIDGVGGLDLKRNSLAGQGLDKNLHTSTKTEYWSPERWLRAKE